MISLLNCQIGGGKKRHAFRDHRKWTEKSDKTKENIVSLQKAIVELQNEKLKLTS